MNIFFLREYCYRNNRDIVVHSGKLSGFRNKNHNVRNNRVITGNAPQDFVRWRVELW